MMAAKVDGRAEPTTSRRVQRKRGRRVQEILRTAGDLFGERGYDAVNLEDVADALDVTKGSLYYYFSSKSELGTAAIETVGDEWLDRLDAIAAEHEGDVATQLRAILHEHLRIAVSERPAAYRLFLVPRDWPQAQAERIKALRRRHDVTFRSVVERGVASGDFTVVSLDATLQCMHATMTQAPIWCARLSAARKAKAIDELTATLMRLVGVEPASGR